MRLKFNVRAQQIFRVDRIPLASDSRLYIAATAVFDSEWDDITARWLTFEPRTGTAITAALADGNSFEESLGVSLSAGTWRVSAHGSNSAGKEIHTSPVLINVAQAGGLDGEAPPYVPPDAAGQIAAVAAEARDIAQSVRDDADAGKFKGDKGDKGDPGSDATVDIVTPTKESTATQAASAKAVWDMLGSGGSGTDISLGVTGASVGDIIKVKAVDDSGKPTEWEAANADEFDVHYKANITEALTEGFSITSVNDTPLQLKEMIAMVKLQNGSSDGQWLGCFVLTDNTNVKFAGTTASDGGVFTGSGEYSYFVYHAKMIPNSQRLLLQTQAVKGRTTSNIIQSTQYHWLNNWLDYYPVNYITGISCANNLGVGTSQGYGTEIEIWGKSI